MQPWAGAHSFTEFKNPLDGDKMETKQLKFSRNVMGYTTIPHTIITL